ncbi:MAG: hypothetical protein AB7N76_23445 [Planctomycetota bacterium]
MSARFLPGKLGVVGATRLELRAGAAVVRLDLAGLHGAPPLEAPGALPAGVEGDALLVELPSPLAPLSTLLGAARCAAEARLAARSLDPDGAVGRALRAASLEARAGWLIELAEGWGPGGWAQAHPHALLLHAQPALGRAPRLLSLGGPGWRRARPDAPDALGEEDLACLAPERLQAWGAGQDPEPGPGEASYALAACAVALLLARLPAPRGLPADAGLNARREAFLGGAGGSVPRMGPRISPAARALLERALDPRPAVRPAPAQLVAGLRRLVEADDLRWSPPPARWTPVLAAGLTLAALFGASHLPRPRAPRRAAIARLAAAAALDDAAQRRLELSALAAADARAPLPEARRLLALEDLADWRAGELRPAPETAALVQRLEREAIAGRDDGLSEALSLLVAFLQRWELGGAASERAAETLRALGDARQPEPLRTVALAAATLDLGGPTGARGAAGDLGAGDLAAGKLGPAAREALARAAGRESPLVYAHALIEYGPGLPQPPQVSLDAGWVAELLLGRLLARDGEREAALPHLRAAHQARPCFATAACLGLELCEGDAAARAEGLTLLAEARRARPAGELALARARVALREGRFESARAAFDEAAGAHPHQAPAAYAAALAAGRRSLELLAACAQLDTEPARALAALDRLLAAQPAETPAPRDLLLGRALALDSLDRHDEATRALEAFLGGDDVSEAFAALPALDPLPATRGAAARARAAALARWSVQRAAERAVESRTPIDVAPLERRLRGLEDAALAQAWVDLARALDPAARAASLARARAALRALAGPDAPPEQTGPAQTGAERAREVQRALLRSHLLEAEGLAPAAAIDALLPGLQLSTSGLAAEGAARDDLLGALRGALGQLRTARRAAWQALSSEAPRPAAELAAEAPQLRAALTALAPKPGTLQVRLLLAEVAHALALLDRAAGAQDPARRAAGQEAARAGLALLEDQPEEPEVTDRRKRLALALGMSLFEEGKQPAAREAFCRAGGVTSFEEWREGLASGFRPLGPTGRELSPAYWVARTHLAEAEAAEGEAKKQALAAARAAYRTFGQLLAKTAPPPGAEGWRGEAARTQQD